MRRYCCIMGVWPEVALGPVDLSLPIVLEGSPNYRPLRGRSRAAAGIVLADPRARGRTAHEHDQADEQELDAQQDPQRPGAGKRELLPQQHPEQDRDGPGEYEPAPPGSDADREFGSRRGWFIFAGAVSI